MGDLEFLRGERRSITAAAIRSVVSMEGPAPLGHPAVSGPSAEPEPIDEDRQLVSETTLLNADGDSRRTLDVGEGFVGVAINDSVHRTLSAPVVFGREPGNRVVLGQTAEPFALTGDGYLSREHIAILAIGNVAHVIDLGSSNGSFLRRAGELITLSPDDPVALQATDAVELGRGTVISVEWV